jgi:hypothetical protein
MNHGECILFVSLNDMLLSTSAGLFESRKGLERETLLLYRRVLLITLWVFEGPRVRP